MTQDELKQQVGRAAVDYVLGKVPSGSVLGVGTGSTANCFIDALASHRDHFAGAVSSSDGTTARLKAAGFVVRDINEVEQLDVYVDGADEIDAQGCMIKGGGGALSREKIVASLANEFVCIADASKQVVRLGAFALPIEVLQMAQAAVMRRVTWLGGRPALRKRADGSIYLTDNGHPIVDAAGLEIADPRALEREINGWAGVVTVGLFAERGADLCLMGRADGIQRIDYRG